MPNDGAAEGDSSMGVEAWGMERVREKHGSEIL